MPDEQKNHGLFAGYRGFDGTFDELFARGDTPLPEFARAVQALGAWSSEEFARCQALAELALLNQGVTFSVYADQRGTEKIFPFCLVPRMISAARLGAPRARPRAAHARARALPRRRLRRAADLCARCRFSRSWCSAPAATCPACAASCPPGGVRIHIAGIDLIRDPDGTFRVLEDNLRTPSGVSYVLENRLITKRIFPHALDRSRVHRVDHYPTRLAETLRSVSPVDPDRVDGGRAHARPVQLGLLRAQLPGAHDGHRAGRARGSVRRRRRGVRAHDARAAAACTSSTAASTTRFLDPEFFRPDSLLGVPGLMRAYAAGNVALANAPGNGVADDKAVYPFVPDMIRFYLGEEPILEQVPTFVCARDDDRAYVLEHLDELVVKAVDEAGGYGMLMGPQSTAAEREEFRRADPGRAAPLHRAAPHRALDLPDLGRREAQRFEPRRVDLRPYILTGREGPWVLPGGLTRVALVEGLVRRQLEPGRRLERHLGAEGAAMREPVMISRVADHCFWFGRYLERAESTARVLSTTRDLALDAELPAGQCWLPVIIGRRRARRSSSNDSASSAPTTASSSSTT